MCRAYHLLICVVSLARPLSPPCDPVGATELAPPPTKGEESAEGGTGEASAGERGRRESAEEKAEGRATEKPHSRQGRNKKTYVLNDKNE